MPLSLKVQGILRNMEAATFQRFAEYWWSNTVANKPYAVNNVLDARPKRESIDRSYALIVAHGPSVKRRNSLEALRGYGFPGLIIAVDSAAAQCLRHGIVPDCIVSVDPRPRIVHNFGGDESDALNATDERYYKSMADESHLGSNPLSTSRANRELFGRYGSQIIGLFSTSTSPRVAQRCREIGLEMYWFNPMYDDYEAPNSFTKKVYDLVPMPCVNAGGNVGTAGWVMAHSIFQAKRVGLIGFDFSYYSGTPRQKTQYYHEMVELFGEDGMDDLLPRFTHPTTGEEYFTDPTYLWFRQSFLEMAQRAPCETVNCTEGGILFGAGIRQARLEEFLQESGDSRARS